MTVTLPLWALAAGVLLTYVFAFAHGKSSGKADVYEEHLGFADDEDDGPGALDADDLE